MTKRRLVVAAAATTVALAGFAAVSGVWRYQRRRAENAEVTTAVRPDLRHWIASLSPTFLTGYDPASPARGSWAEKITDLAAPRGLGKPVTIPGRDSDPAVPAFLYEPPGRVRPGGAVLWIHGGAFIIGGSWMDHGLCTRIAKELGVLVLSVDYRLAPEHPFPAAPEDCFTALAWLHEHAEEHGIDRRRIAVGGESAGSGLAAVLAQMALDRGLPLAFQALLYPMLDDRTALREPPAGVGELIWTAAKNRDAWAWYLGHEITEREPRAYASAARREDLSGLPPAWIGVGALDLFHHEDLEYARRLGAAGVEVDLLEVPGMPHGVDMLQFVPSMRAFRGELIAALGAAIAPPSA